MRKKNISKKLLDESITEQVIGGNKKEGACSVHEMVLKRSVSRRHKVEYELYQCKKCGKWEGRVV